jgi:ABC-type uncharacterized transport system auxiliary subunit
MNNTYSKLAKTLALVALLTSCKTMQIDRPKESYLPSTLAPTMSELPLEVEVDVKKLEAAINKKMNGYGRLRISHSA